VALGSRQHIFEVALSDIDRGVYESLTLRPALHPSESEPYLVTRVLALALEYEPGIAFSRGLEAADEPAVWVKDLTGQLRTWIEVGTPDAARLHKASKAADRVVVYCHKHPDIWLAGLQGAKIHAAGALELVLLDRAFIAELAARIERRTAWSLTITEGTVYLDVGDASLVTTLDRRRLG
jgi:uncharacterized protein YaeQ